MCAASTASLLRPQGVPGLPLGRLAELAALEGPVQIRPAGGSAAASGGSAVPVPSEVAEAGGTRVTGITLRAQHVRPGDLFAALPGASVHGAAFAAEAQRAGAVAILTDPAGAAVVAADRGSVLPLVITEQPRAVLGSLSAAVYRDPSRSAAVIGVTGTSGKTTTCYLIEAVLTAGGIRSGLIGTVQTRIAGVPAPSALTTPEAPDLQALFAVMVERGVQAVAMEVSSHALLLGRVAGTHFRVGAFTNLSQDHLDFHPDMESYFQAKSLLFDGRAEAGVIVIDDRYGVRLSARYPSATTVSATGSPASWTVLHTEPGTGGRQHLVVRAPNGKVREAELALPGSFNIANAVLALACVQAANLGVDLDQAIAGLAQAVVPGRMERVSSGQDFLAVVDYAHKPAALTAVLQAVSRGLEGRLIVVIGAGGDRDRGKRTLMGANAAGWADLVIVTDDNPRSESPAAIRAAILAGATGAPHRERAGSAEVREVGDRHEAIRVAVRAARSGDAVVVAGKGHEEGQEVGGVVHPFSDRAELRIALAEAGFAAADAAGNAGGSDRPGRSTA